MHANCPECKNTIDLAEHGSVNPETIIECPMCGMTLMVTAVNDDVVEVEIVDEGK